MKPDSPGWQVRDFNVSDGYYGYPSGLKLLQKEWSDAGTATTTITIPRAGKYRIWVRCLDRATSAPYSLQLTQNSKQIAQAQFDDKTNRAPEPNEASYKGRAFVWWSFDADLAQGPCTLEIAGQKSGYGPAAGVDCFAMTTDLTFKPRMWCFAQPLYLRLVMGPKHNKLGGVAYFNGRIDFEGYFTGAGDINMQGYRGITTGFEKPAQMFLYPGYASPWVNIGTSLDPRGMNRLRFEILSDWAVEMPDADFTLEIARTAGGPPVYCGHREGKGSGMILLIDPRHPEEAKSNIEWSAIRLKQALETPAPLHGKAPNIFPSFTGLNDYDTSDPEPAIQNDLMTLRALGFTGSTAYYRNPKWMEAHGMIYDYISTFIYSYVMQPRCLSEPDSPNLRKWFVSVIKDFYSEMPHVLFFRLMDEISSMSVAEMKTCPGTVDKFHDYLRAQGLQPADLLGHAPDPGKDPWESIQFTEDKQASPKLYYYTQLFRVQILVDFFKNATTILQQLMPGARTGANGSGELTYTRNGLDRGADIFQLYKSNALTYGYAEDANSACPSGQTADFVMDCLRSACKYNHQPYATYNMSYMPPWDDETKAFAEIGHGVKFVHFYDYGPYHSDSSDPWAGEYAAQSFPAWKEFNYALGSAENDLYNAEVVPSRVALLYSETTDVWTSTNDNVSGSGSERVYLYLLLKHLGYPIDIITEDDVLDGRARGYDAIFTAESHFKDGVVAKLLAWTQQGGFLYVGAGAGRFNQFNQPVPGFEVSGLKLGSFFPYVGASWPQNLNVVDKIPVDGKMLEAAGGKQPVAPGSAGQVVAHFADGTPCATQIAYGKGKLLYVGFFPGTSYVRPANIREVARQAAQFKPGEPGLLFDTFFASWYPEEGRSLMQSLLKPLGIIPPVRIDNYLVEGNLLQGKNGDVLALANWSAHKQVVHITVDLPYSPGSPRAAINSLQEVKRTGNSVSFTMTLGPGNFVSLPPLNQPLTQIDSPERAQRSVFTSQN